MIKKNFWKIEYSVTLLVILGAIMLFMPIKFENYLQANLITRWNDRYEKVVYMFNVITAQTDDDILKSFNTAETAEQREKLLLQLIKPYLRVHNSNKFPRRYKPKFLNGSRVPKNNFYSFTDLYFAGKQIIGIKDITNSKETSAWFMIMFDINGLLPPNVWGKDIFGIYIFDEGKIRPFGYDKVMDELKEDCSQNGSGVTCSYYYRIGGGFND